jgi:hypothetical protein
MSSPVHVLPVANSYDLHHQPRIFDPADNPVVAHAILPELAEFLALERRPNATRIFRRHNSIFEKCNDPSRCLPVQLAELLDCAVSKLNRPGQGLFLLGKVESSCRRQQRIRDKQLRPNKYLQYLRADAPTPRACNGILVGPFSWPEHQGVFRVQAGGGQQALLYMYSRSANVDQPNLTPPPQSPIARLFIDALN